MSSPRTIKDLPIYGDSQNESNKPLWIVVENPEKSELEKFVSETRQTACGLMRQFNDQTEYLTKALEQNKLVLKNQLEYVRSETNLIPKVAFISLSGLSGLLLGYRKSTFRKLLYSTLLTGGATSLCYPTEARVYSSKAYEVGSKNAMDLYRAYIWPEETKKVKKVEAVQQAPKAMDPKDTVVKLDKETIESTESKRNIVGDKGQASDEDKDMYTTRK
ncbi:unnamed protein product [Brachionus calyciflorus]|uniref:MICOS complex subunit n=1 Tax=Brachionus calyciflorus TaxID=104777 RepID=A0A813N6M1_9BILA|nr:unnamed protein product [Brachionus calyciflorus]